MLRRNHRRRNHHRRRRHRDDYELKEIAMDIATHPAVKYMAVGVGAALLSGLASKASRKYPEISRFIQDNIDLLESNMDFMRFEIEESSRQR